MDFSTTLDLIISVLLIGTIAYAFALNRTLSRVREGRDGMEQLIRDLSTAVARAESAIGHLRDSASKADAELNGRIRTARDLVNELEIINESGNTLAVRLEGAVKIARAMQAAPSPREAEMAEPRRPSSPVKQPVPPAKVADRAGMVASSPKAPAAEPAMRRAAQPMPQMRAEDHDDLPEADAPGPAVVPFKGQAAPKAVRADMERELFDALEILRQGRS